MQSFGHKTVISSQSKLHIQSKNFFNNTVTFHIRINNMSKKDNMMQSFGHKSVISSQSKLHIQSKNFFNKTGYI